MPKLIITMSSSCLSSYPFPLRARTFRFTRRWPLWVQSPSGCWSGTSHFTIELWPDGTLWPGSRFPHSLWYVVCKTIHQTEAFVLDWWTRIVLDMLSCF